MEPPSRDNHTQTDDNESEPEFNDYGDGEYRRDSDGHPIFVRMNKNLVDRIRFKASIEIDKNGVEYIPSPNKNTKGTLTIQGRPMTFKYARNHIVIPHLDDDVKYYGYTAVAGAIGKELRDPIYGKRGERARKKRKEEEEKKKKEIEEAERNAAVTVRRAEAAVALANRRLRETEQKRKDAEDDAWAARKKRKEEEDETLAIKTKRLEGERKWKESVEKAMRARKVAEAKFDSEMQLTFQAILDDSSSVQRWGNSLFFDPEYRLVGNKRQRIS